MTPSLTQKCQQPQKCHWVVCAFHLIFSINVGTSPDQVRNRVELPFFCRTGQRVVPKLIPSNFTHPCQASARQLDTSDAPSIPCPPHLALHHVAANSPSCVYGPPGLQASTLCDWSNFVRVTIDHRTIADTVAMLLTESRSSIFAPRWMSHSMTAT